MQDSDSGSSGFVTEMELPKEANEWGPGACHDVRSHKASGLSKSNPAIGFVQPLVADMAYFFVDMHIYMPNLREKTVEDCLFDGLPMLEMFSWVFCLRVCNLL